ncbi:MAG: BLUF domain-containing protein [Vicinamibacterales bacterium]
MTTEPDTRDVCLAYASAATREFTPGELAQILAKAGSHNLQAGITGMLLYTDGSFFQVLEGAEDVVHKLYDKIQVDPRHSQAIKLIEEPIEKRAFSQWSMGFAKVTRSELAKIPGLNDFFGHGSSFYSLGEGRAKTLLAAFRDGRWRRRLNG